LSVINENLRASQDAKLSASMDGMKRRQAPTTGWEDTTDSTATKKVALGTKRTKKKTRVQPLRDEDYGSKPSVEQSGRDSVTNDESMTALVDDSRNQKNAIMLTNKPHPMANGDTSEVALAPYGTNEYASKPGHSNEAISFEKNGVGRSQESLIPRSSIGAIATPNPDQSGLSTGVVPTDREKAAPKPLIGS